MPQIRHIASNCLFVLLLMTLSVNSVMGQEVADRSSYEPIEPIPEVQLHIKLALEALNKNDPTQGNQGAGRPLEELLTAKDLAQGDDIKLVLQLAYATTKWPAPEEAVALLTFLNLLGVDEDDVVAALAPYLGSNDKLLDEFTRLCFQRIGGGRWKPNRPLEPVNYRVYSDYIKRQLQRGEPLPEQFVVWMFDRAPNFALLAFVYAHESARIRQREVLWCEHLISDAIWKKENGFQSDFEKIKTDAISALGKLAINRNWWARLYVAEIIRQHPELRTDALVEQLRKDENALVREIAAAKPNTK